MAEDDFRTPQRALNLDPNHGLRESGQQWDMDYTSTTALEDRLGRRSSAAVPPDSRGSNVRPGLDIGETMQSVPYTIAAFNPDDIVDSNERDAWIYDRDEVGEDDA